MSKNLENRRHEEIDVMRSTTNIAVYPDDDSLRPIADLIVDSADNRTIVGDVNRDEL